MASEPETRSRRRWPEPAHDDPGVQPERTVMSWGRTSMATGVVAMLLIRWYPSVGAVVFVPVLIAMIGAGLIQSSQRKRYRIQVTGITNERVDADFWAVLWMTVMAILIATAGLISMWAA